MSSNVLRALVAAIRGITRPERPPRQIPPRHRANPGEELNVRLAMTGRPRKAPEEIPLLDGQTTIDDELGPPCYAAPQPACPGREAPSTPTTSRQH